MATNATKDFLNLNSYKVAELLNSLSTATIIARPSGKIVAINDAGQKLLKAQKFNQINLKEFVKIIKHTKNEIVRDYPLKNRVLRLYGQYLNIPNKKPLILINLLDATEDWLTARRQDILEYTVSTFSQSINNPAWIQSVLKRIVVMMNIKSAEVMIYDPLTRLLHQLDNPSKKTALGKGPLGRAARLRTPIAIYNDSKPQNSKNSYSLLIVPMIIGNKLIGILNIRDEPGKYFREQDKAFYSIIANRLALSIEYRNLLAKLEKQHERLTTAINNTRHGMALLTADGSILIANAALAGILGQNIVDLVGKKIETLIPEFKIDFQDNAKQITKELQLESIESKPWIKITAARTALKRNSNIVLTISDTTAEKMIEQMKNDFIASATHELRTPITAVMGYLSMLANKQNNFDSKQKYYLQRINESSKILFNLVEDLLAVLRLDQEKAVVKPRKQNLLPLVKKVLRGLETKINNKELKIKLSPKDMTVYADTSALQKVLSNLIDNAIKYSKPGGQISIKITRLNRGKQAKVTISDTGVGIPKKEQDKIFEKFHRVPNELSVEAGGTGLGLYISSKLVEQWRGKLKLEASSAHGSTFSFTVPTKKELALDLKHKKSDA